LKLLASSLLAQLKLNVGHLTRK